MPEVREAQADLARRYGVTGFCYWHYWFAGRRLLERPFDEVVASGHPDFPFCVAWANQTWSGIWHGAPDRILIEQTYPGPEDDRAHFASLLPAFCDPRYVRIAGRPLLFVYQPGEPARAGRGSSTRGRRWPVDAGLGGLYLVACLGRVVLPGPGGDGFDAGVLLPVPVRPHHRGQGPRAADRPGTGPGTEAVPLRRSGWPTHRPEFTGPVLPAVYPNWDNTPRSGRAGVVATGATPSASPPTSAVDWSWRARRPDGEQVLVIKSWNEWAEGNYLEPDRETGTARLEALRRELARAGHLAR